MIRIDVEESATVAVVRCIGRLTRGEAVNRLRHALVSGKTTHMILLDLSHVEALDAGGVNALVSVRDWAVSRGITVKLVNPSTFVRETLTRFRLEHLFEISSLHDALVILASRKGLFWSQSPSCGVPPWPTADGQVGAGDQKHETCGGPLRLTTWPARALSSS